MIDAMGAHASMPPTTFMRTPLLPLALLALLGACLACRRAPPPPDGATSSSASTTTAAIAEASNDQAWRGKHLHLWISACDARSPEITTVLQLIEAHPALKPTVGLACQAVARDGSFTTAEGAAGQGRAAIAERLHAEGIETSILIANPGAGGFDGALGLALLEDGKARARLLDGLERARAKEHHAAIELDFEGMASAAAQPFARFVAEVTKATAAKPIALDVHPKTVDDPGWDGPGSHDYVALAKSGAILRLMTYDLSIGPVPPGPSTKASWIEQVVGYARSKGVPPAQLEIGLPAYGYDFPPGGKQAAIALHYDEVLALQKRENATVIRDDASTPHFNYEGEGGGHEVWFDDATSLAHLLRELRPVAREVRGIAIWGLVGGDPKIAKVLEAEGL